MPEVTDLASRAATAAKETSQQYFTQAQQQTRQLADSAQRYIQENPLRALSYSSAAVLGLGIIIGRLLAPSVTYDASSIAAAAREHAPRWRDAARETSQAWLEATKGRSGELLSAAQDRSREILDSTQEYVGEHPLRSAAYGAAALLGLALVMSLVSSSGSEKDQG